jgi:hypothetical protein
VTTTGFPTPSITESGALPAGVTFVDNGNGTGTLSGTPTASGTFTIAFTAQNGVSPNATQNFTLTVNQAPAITSVNATTFQVGVAGTFTVTTTGFPTPSITESGALPAGVTFHDNGNGTGALSGTPTASGTFTIAFTAQNGVSPNATQNFTLTVNQVGDFTISASPGSQTTNAGHNPTYTISLTSQGGLTGSVSLSCSGGPPNSSCDISPSSVMLDGTAQATITLQSPMSNNHGTFTLTFTGSLGILTHSTSVSLTVK